MAKKKVEQQNVIIGHMLQVAREQHGVTQAEMVESTGLTKNHISAVERGVSKASIPMLLGYCSKLGITPNDILKFDESTIIPELVSLLFEMDESQQRKVVELIKVMQK
jgi:transcriptional regulator with XRE-family HTH domain